MTRQGLRRARAAARPGRRARRRRPDLLNAIQGMKPVRTRTRFGALALVALVGLIWPVGVLAHHAYRPDLGALPLGWVIAAAALCGRGVRRCR